MPDTSAWPMNETGGRVVLRDQAGWMFLAATGLLGVTPILMGMDKIVFTTGAALRRMDAAAEIIGFLFAASGVVLLFTAHVLNAYHWRLAHRHDPEIAPFFRNRQLIFIAATLLCWWLVATMNHLEQQGGEGFLGGAAGVLTGLILLFATDSRFTPRDVIDED